MRSRQRVDGLLRRGESALLPLILILIEMSSRTMEQAPELKTNPPPFKQSVDRLQMLLKSTPLRPTMPSMPDMAGPESEKLRMADQSKRRRSAKYSPSANNGFDTIAVLLWVLSLPQLPQ